MLLDLRNEAMDARAARCIQSIGLVVDYLAVRGLVDRNDLTRHIEQHFEAADPDESDDPSIPAIDVYGWLRWTAAIRDLRERGRPPWAELIDPIWSSFRSGTGAFDPHVEVGATGVMQSDA